MSPRSPGRVIAAAFAFFAVYALVGSPALAQQGAVTGTVVRATNGEPLDAVQVVVVGTGLGTITDADGNFRITDVPTGEQQVRAQLVGYSTRTRTVTVQAGQASNVEFELRQSAVQLEQIVVTGTGTGGMQKKRLGNTVATVNTDQLENAPTLNVTEMLAAREPGMQILNSSGMSTEGGRIRIRGAASLSQSNEPVIYIDGVRINSGGGFAGGASAGAQGAGASSRLDDLNPASIERVEVLKGAAAATLYGTEASNGVIQIFTKRGREGRTRWNFEVEQGLEFMPTGRLIPHSDFARTQSQLDRMQERWDAPNLEMYEPITRMLQDQISETGRLTNLSGSVNGGGGGLTYFVSGRYSNINGIMGLENLGPASDKSERWQTAANLNATPASDVTVSLSTNYSFIQQQAPQTANNIFSPWASIYDAQLRLAESCDFSEPCNNYGTPAWNTIEEGTQITTGQEVSHFRTSLQPQWQPGENLTLAGTFGADVTTNESWTHFPFGWNVDNFSPFFVNGTRSAGTENHYEITAEIRTGWEAEISEAFSSSFTAGTQSFLRQTRVREGSGDGFGGPGLEDVGAAASQTTDETLTENVNIGTFAQEQIGYRDFAYLTLGGRWDVNSAFGSEVQGEFYPKVSVSVVLSDMEGWESETFSTVRLRGAFGESGLQPSSFARFRTFSGTGSPLGPGVEPQNLGNPELSPEVSREFELGANLGLFNDRLSIDGTVWTRTVNDALVQKQFPISGGFSSLQLTNIGQLDAHGVDLSVNGTVIQSDDVQANVFGNTAYLSQNVADLGGAPPIKTGGAYPRNRNFIKEGLPPGAYLGAKLQDVPIPLDLDNSCSAPSEQEALTYFSQPRNPSDFEVLPQDCGEADLLQNFLGNPWPDWSGSFGTDVSFLDRFHFRALAEYKFGHQVQDLSGAFRRSNALIGRNTPGSAEVTATLMDPSSSAEERLEAAKEWAREYRALSPMSGLNQIYDADWIRWREASLTYDMPRSIASAISARTMSVSLMARNLTLWVTDDYRGIDPELNNSGRCAGGGQGTNVDCNFLMGQEAWRMPIPRRFTLSVSAGF